MKTYLELDNWPRREHFAFFSTFDEPFFGVTVQVDCTSAYAKAKQDKTSFFLYYLHKTMKAVNECEPFRYRIEKSRIAIYDRVDVSATISRPDDSFGFSFIEYDADFDVFSANASREIERVQEAAGLFTRTFEMQNLVHFSAIPWIDFTSLSHARAYRSGDSCPKISFGKMSVDDAGRRQIPMSVHVHHALMDGKHLGDFIDCFTALMAG